MESSGQVSKNVAVNVSELITILQFQDRTKQRLENINDTMTVLSAAAGELQTETKECANLPADSLGVDKQWLQRMITDMTLGEMRERFVTSMLMAESTDGISDPEGPETMAVAHSEGSDDIELFLVRQPGIAG